MKEFIFSKRKFKVVEFYRTFLIKFKLFVDSYLSEDNKNLGLLNLFTSVYKVNNINSINPKNYLYFL